jgi:tetratricopeptide (TPR) repeat protein
MSYEKGLAYLRRLVDLGVDHKARIYRKIAHVYTVDRNYPKALTYLEAAAEHAAKQGSNELPADHLWVEAAATAVEMDDLQKAMTYVRKALGHNPRNRVARGLLEQLSRLAPAGS